MCEGTSEGRSGEAVTKAAGGQSEVRWPGEEVPGSLPQLNRKTACRLRCQHRVAWPGIPPCPAAAKLGKLAFALPAAGLSLPRSSRCAAVLGHRARRGGRPSLLPAGLAPDARQEPPPSRTRSHPGHRVLPRPRRPRAADAKHRSGPETGTFSCPAKGRGWRGGTFRSLLPAGHRVRGEAGWEPPPRTSLVLPRRRRDDRDRAGAWRRHLLAPPPRSQPQQRLDCV